MKILEINAFYYPRGGSESVFFNTSELLRRHGHQVIPFALKWEENIPGPYNRYFPESKDTRSGLMRVPGNIVSYFYHSEAASKLQRLIDDEHPDVAQIHLIWGQLSPSILKVLRRNGIPAVLTVHDYRLVCPDFLFRDGSGQVCEECQGHRFWKCVARRCCRGSRGLSLMMAAEQYFRNSFFHPARMLNGLVYVSDFSRDIHHRYMPQLREVPDVRLYNTAPSIACEPQAPGDYYLYFGRLSAEKGVATLLSAAAKLPDVKFKIAGSGPLEAELKETARRLGLKNVDFVGFKKGEELHRLIDESRMVVVPSECYENNPLSVVEAYSAGVPVIGAAIGGIPEIVPEGRTGFTFPAGDADALAEAIAKAEALSPDALMAMRRDALAFARLNFDPERYYEKLIAFFTTLAGKK
ncbi:MAG: glycosyltransferase family 4 protein [Duncaniella sp.]|nr:glycosyltransferase family 4 protein [Duncaniella sp.]